MAAFSELARQNVELWERLAGGAADRRKKGE
jgi:hypothetical protein